VKTLHVAETSHVLPYRPRPSRPSGRWRICPFCGSLLLGGPIRFDNHHATWHSNFIEDRTSIRHTLS